VVSLKMAIVGVVVKDRIRIESNPTNVIIDDGGARGKRAAVVE